MALEYLTIAKSFAKGAAKIYVARGCALANLVMLPLDRTIFKKDSGKSKKPSG